MKKRIGILTFHFVDNYGALLQGAALRKFLSDRGHEVAFIDYRPDHVINGGTFWPPTSLRNLRANVAVAYFRWKKIRGAFSRNQEQESRFAAFRERFLPHTARRYSSLAALNESPPEFDVYVCGSDQIWNASRQFGIDPAYFLNFGGPEVRRVSYAASFGRARLADDELAQVGRLLGRLDHISVRESSGVGLVEELIGVRPACLPDPTLLLNDYSGMIAPIPSRPEYVFSYALRSAEGISDVHDYVQRKLGLAGVVPWNSATRGKIDAEESDCGPAEWLAHIRSANFVVTNSFHGTVFSILFRKPFLTVGLTGAKSAFNERAVSLLTRLGLEHRMVFAADPTSLDALIAEAIDWERVGTRLEAWRAEVTEFCESALS